MTTLGEISEKLEVDKKYDFFSDMKKIDIGDYEFTDFKRIGEFYFLYSNKNNPNIRLVFNEDRAAAILYLLNKDGTINATSWRLGKIHHKLFNKDDIDSKIFK